MNDSEVILFTAMTDTGRVFFWVGVLALYVTYTALLRRIIR